MKTPSDPTPAAATKSLNRVAEIDSPEQIERQYVSVLSAGQPIQPKFTPKLGLEAFRSWVYVAATLNAQRVASVPLRLYARSGGDSLYATKAVPRHRRSYLLGDSKHGPSVRTIAKAVEFGDDFEEVTERHPASVLLRTINPYMGGFDFITLMMQWVQLTGNAYMAPVIGPLGVPVELWGLQPDMVWAIPGRERLIDAWRFGRSQANAIEIEADGVLQFKQPHPRDPIYGLGVVEAMWSVVQQNEAAHEMDYATYANHARPDYAVIVRDGASSEAIAALQKKLNQKHRGTGKSGKGFVATGDIKITPLQWAPKDMSGREEMVTEIANGFRVPIPVMLGNDATRANAETGHSGWALNTILPYCRQLEDFLNEQYLPLFVDAETGERLSDQAVFAFDNPVESNRELEIRETTEYTRGGIMTPNEGRLKLGLDASDDPMADVLLFNNQPIGSAVSLGADPMLADGGDAVDAAPVAPVANPNDAVVADAALNGAQVTALLELVRAATAGEIAVEAARIMARVSFPLMPEAEINSLFAAIKPREFVDPSQPTQAPAPNEGKALMTIAEMVDKHNAEHGDTVSLAEAVKVYMEAA